MNNDIDEIKMQILDLIAECFEVDRALVVPEARLKADLGIDSIDGIDLLVAIEKRFGLRFNTDQLSDWRTVNDVMDALPNGAKAQPT
ncbi:acyl carrier protein [Dyella psychrodurans]|uniref:Acyl carrier protein n=1 Tax=Dyella psychrodurans TaxID=1927960 RepID=A0A370XCF4_9GAMM|nr:acyl carrier protein [Dyella psychrodurans]RDS86113.1 acyl carrier protein [Dyella psychrodurans]